MAEQVLATEHLCDFHRIINGAEYKHDYDENYVSDAGQPIKSIFSEIDTKSFELHAEQLDSLEHTDLLLIVFTLTNEHGLEAAVLSVSARCALGKVKVDYVGYFRVDIFAFDQVKHALLALEEALREKQLPQSSQVVYLCEYGAGDAGNDKFIAECLNEQGRTTKVLKHNRYPLFCTHARRMISESIQANWERKSKIKLTYTHMGARMEPVNCKPTQSVWKELSSVLHTQLQCARYPQRPNTMKCGGETYYWSSKKNDRTEEMYAEGGYVLELVRLGLFHVYQLYNCENSPSAETMQCPHSLNNRAKALTPERQRELVISYVEHCEGSSSHTIGDFVEHLLQNDLV